jgi:ketosteroid isomerase-like protein
MRPLLVATLVLLQPSVGIKLPHRSEPPSLPTRQYLDDMRSKNLDDILLMYLPDAVFVDPSGHKFSTPEARRQLYERTFATYDSELVFTETKLKWKGDTSKAGNVAVETDGYHENLRTRSTKVMQQVCGTCVFTWVRQTDGVWLLSSQKWTIAACPATPAP